MKFIALAVLTCCAFGAQAAANVGALDNVVGSVSVGGQGVFAQAKNGMPLAEGSTVLVANKSKATVLLANGCSVSLLGSQHFIVNSKLNCEQSIASVKSLAAITRLAQAGLGAGVPAAGGAGAAGAGMGAIGGIATGTIVAGAIAAGVLAAVVSNNQSDKASGS